MPDKNGTGPRWGSSPMTGKGAGRGGRGLGRMRGTGAGGECFCPSCGVNVPHQTGSPCSAIKCPICGRPLVRG